MVNQCVDLFRFIGVDHQPRTLVHQQQVFVFIHHVELRVERGEEFILLRVRPLKKLVIDVHLQHVAFLQPDFPLGAFAVDLHPFEPDVFLHQSRGRQGRGLCHKPVQPLSGVIFIDGEFT